jgi:uncharacterized protein YndB with AHSA1/START domain
VEIKPEIKITLYIDSSSTKVWDALTNSEIKQKYWSETRLESDWKVGSKLIYRRNGEIPDENTALMILVAMAPFAIVSGKAKPKKKLITIRRDRF